MRQRIGWLILFVAFLALNAMLFSRLGEDKGGAIHASALRLGFR